MLDNDCKHIVTAFYIFSDSLCPLSDFISNEIKC